MTLIKQGKDLKVMQSIADSEGRYCIVEIEYRQTQIVIANIYAPNEDKPEFFSKVFDDIGKFENANIMVIGDFNLLLNPKIDRKDGR